MNLHLIPDDKYVSRFIQRIENLSLLETNKFFIKAIKPYKYVFNEQVHPAQIGGQLINPLIGDTRQYDKVFIHFMDELSIDFVASRQFNKLIWLPWGADIYQSLFSPFSILDKYTKRLLRPTCLNKVNRSVYKRFQRLTKVIKYRKAYSKVDTIINWIPQEFDYALKHLPGIRAENKFFIYDQDIPFHALASFLGDPVEAPIKYRIMVGYSGMPNNNHLRALMLINQVTSDVQEVSLPISYGDMNYVKLLENEVAKRKSSYKITFHKSYTSFEKYIQYLNSFDCLVFNPIRPAGMGNFWVGIFLGKRVFLNRQNLAFPFLKSLGLDFYAVDQLLNLAELPSIDINKNKKLCLDFFAESRIAQVYQSLFN